MYRAWQLSKLAYNNKWHWVELLFGTTLDRWMHTVNVNYVTYHLMLEDERQRLIDEKKKSGVLVFDPDAEIKAKFMQKNRNFAEEIFAVKLQW